LLIQLTITLLFTIGILLTSCVPKNCASAKADYDNAQREYENLSQQLIGEYRNGRIHGSEITRVANELYAKSKPSADRLAAAQINYREVCKLTSTNEDKTYTPDVQLPNKTEEKKEVPIIESIDSSTTIPADELATKNNLIGQDKQRTSSCVAKMQSGEIKAYNLCIKKSRKLK
jgi:hypothetical protein